MIKQYHPLQNRQLSLEGIKSLNIYPGQETARFSLRINPSSQKKAGEIFGLSLPEKIGNLTLPSESEKQDHLALMVGPDEWYLTTPPSAHDQIIADFTKLYESEIHSLVDISNREISIVIEGKKAAYLLQAVMAFDVENMPYPSGRRTLFERVQVILLREREDYFRIEVWASFAEHVWYLLENIFNEIKAGL